MKLLNVIAVLSALSWASSGVCATSTFAETSASATGGAADFVFEGDADGGSNQSSSSAASGGAGGTGDASAAAGVIKVFASMTSPAGAVLGSGSAKGRYSEDITISSAGFNGLKARILTSVSLQGKIDPQGSGGGQVIFGFGLGTPSTVFSGSWTGTADPSITTGGFPSEFVSATLGGPLFFSGIHEQLFEITIGASFRIAESLDLSTFKVGCQSAGFNGGCAESAQGSVDVDFGHSSYWNGISAISLQDPNTGAFNPADLNLFSLSSTSGANWFESFVPQAPVPLPAAAWLLGSALGAFGLVRRLAR